MIEKNELLAICAEWQERLSSHSLREVQRRVLDASKLELDPDIVFVIQGVRRGGKSTLLGQIQESMRLKKKDCVFINFEDPRLSENLSHELLTEILQCTKKTKTEKKYYFFDEIQNVDQWEKWLHTQLEKKQNNHFIITGSNASLLSGKLGTALTGRHLSLELFPFDFYEFREFTKINDLKKYFELGGMPKPLAIKDSANLLREYFNDIIERDVRRHVSARSAVALSQIAKMIFESTGSECSFRTIQKATELSVDTVKNYVEALSAAYLILPCPFFSFSERQRVVRPSKYYPIDLALMRAVVTRKKTDIGKNLETIVFHHLRRKYKDVFYWRDKNEIDFVVQTENGILPIQVSSGKLQERHSLALEQFRKTYPDVLDALFISFENVEEFLL